MVEADPIEELKAIAHPLRLRILQALANGERNVGEIEEASNIGQPGLSQQLAVLRQADLVTTRREGKLVYYGVDREALLSVIACVQAIAGDGARDQGGGNDGDVADMTRTPSPGAANFARLLV